MTNEGTIIARDGELDLRDVVLESTGTLRAESSGVLSLFGGRVTADSIDIDSGGAFDLNSGRLETPQFNGDFFQDGGTFAPGNAPGQANGVGDSVLTGNYTIDDTTATNATLEIELATPDLFDRFTVGGDLNLLTGQLSVVALDGFSVSAGDVFDVVNVEGSRTGTFLGLDEGATIPGIGNTFSITYVAGDGNDISLVSTLTPGSVNLPVAGTSDVAFVFGTRGPSAEQTISLTGLDILPGGDFTLGPAETLNLDDGNGTLFVSEGSTFTGNGLVNGNILNAGLVRIPIVALEQTTGGHVIVTGPTPVFTAPTAVRVNATTLVDFTPTPIARIEAPVVESSGTLAFDASLEVTGDFTQTETGALRLFIGGESPGVSFSQLIVGGDITLDGAIEVVWQPELFDTFDFEPELGQTFDFLVADGQITLADSLEIRQLVTVAGASFFSGFELSSFDSGISSDPDDLLLIGGDTLFSFGLAEGGTTLRATVLATVPEPSSLVLLVVAGVSCMKRRPSWAVV